MFVRCEFNMRKVTLPRDFEKYDFSALAKKEKNSALKIRYLALSYLQMGKTVLEAAELVYKSSRMVHRWISRFNQAGIEGLKDKSGRGRKVQLPQEKEDEFRLIVLEFQRTKASGKLTGRDIQKLLLDNYDISCTLPTAYNTLARLNLQIVYGQYKKIHKNVKNVLPIVESSNKLDKLNSNLR